MNCEKRPYADKKTALTAANYRTFGRGRRRNRPDYLRAYYCEECKAWHLTHKPDRAL